MTTVNAGQQELRTQAVNVLTRAAQRSLSHTASLDFAGFLAEVLAATAANVGGPDLLLAARPGSWEASHVDALLRGTMGDDPDDWLSLRTEPLAISLNVAELVESGDLHPGLLGLDAAVDEVGARYESAVEDEALDACDTEIEALIATSRSIGVTPTASRRRLGLRLESEGSGSMSPSRWMQTLLAPGGANPRSLIPAG